MSWPPLGKLLLMLLFASAIVSVAVNVVLVRQTIQDYRDLNETRLDPLGLEVFARGSDQLANGLRITNTVVFFGDSRAQDWPAPSDMSTFTFINRGIGSQTSSQAVGRFDLHVQSLHPAIVIVQVGINDLKTIPLFPEQKAKIVEECENNINQIVTKATTGGAIVILATIFPVGMVPIERTIFWSSDVNVAILEVNSYIRSRESPGVIILDAYSILAVNDTTQPKYSRDTLHLNSTGYSALNAGLKKILSRLQ